MTDFGIARQRLGFEQVRSEIGMSQEAHIQALLQLSSQQGKIHEAG
ncbi:hypothetical protein [Rahnella ecdela]|uniref:Uncharacterized protein n=1 Tax=Rahnella ecdela TaxID=2816250 RepID=A0ABS6LDK2_9GAMM|nr:hypothetical protein [Rahnella ecdela]MBU9844845.1 hypothetical protein [Rahnella ecdela]